jgi:hypothetical protein
MEMGTMVNIYSTVAGIKTRFLTLPAEEYVKHLIEQSLPPFVARDICEQNQCLEYLGPDLAAVSNIEIVDIRKVSCGVLTSALL